MAGLARAPPSLTFNASQDNGASCASPSVPR